MTRQRILAPWIALPALLASVPPTEAQEGAEVLARELANPVASLISVPLHFNLCSVA